MSKQRLIVIGNGMAGNRLVEDILAQPEGRDHYDITIFGAEPYSDYNRILLSSVLAGDHHLNDIFMHLPPWYQENNITLYAGEAVEKIDLAGKQVFATNGITVSYDKLVIATGSTPFIPTIDNLYTSQQTLKKGVFVFRTIEDCQNILSHISQSRRAVVIGGGVLGLEAAYGLRCRGLEVHVAHVSRYVMNTQLDMLAGKLVKSQLESLNIQVHLAKKTVGILGEEAVSGLLFEDSSTLDCDMVVLSAGIRPNIALAQQAGIHVERGIVVDDQLATNVGDVYALGECTQHRGRTYGLVAPLWEQARCLAKHLIQPDSNTSYEGSREAIKLKVAGIELAVMGEKESHTEESDDEVVTYIEPSRGVYKKLIVRNEHLVGAVLVGDGHAMPRVLQLFDRQTPIQTNRSELLFPMNGEGSTATSAADQPDGVQICNCNGVSKGTIVSAIEDGHCNVKSVCQATRAGTGCGSCLSQIREIVTCKERERKKAVGELETAQQRRA